MRWPVSAQSASDKRHLPAAQVMLLEQGWPSARSARADGVQDGDEAVAVWGRSA